MDREEFLRQLQRIKEQMTDFSQNGREFLQSLPEVDDDALEALTPEADLLGTLECLLGDDLEPALKKIGELEGLLQADQGPNC